MNPFANNTYAIRENRLSVVIPAFNEHEGIAGVIQELDEVLILLPCRCSILVVDDGSEDDTAEIVGNLRTRSNLGLICLTRNFGKEVAITAGLDACKNEDAVVIMDADGQHPPKLIADFVHHWRKGYDDVYGVRQSRNSENRFTAYMKKLFYRTAGAYTVYIDKDAGDFRLLSAPVVDAICQMPERTRFMKGLYNWVGFRKIGIPYDVRQRQQGCSKFSLGDLVRFGVEGMISFTTRPLRLISRIGFLVSGAALCYGLYILVKTLIIGVDTPGWATLTVALTMLSGIQLISIGVLGEYIGQIFIESKDRPLYLVARHIEVGTENIDSIAS